MGCCGEPADDEPLDRTQLQLNEMVAAQPTGQPILEKPDSSPLGSYRPPDITTPPPATINATFASDFSNQAAPPWGHSSSSPAQHPHVVPTPPMPSPSPGTFTLSSYQRNGSPDHLLRPQNVYYPPLNGQGTLGMPPSSIDLSNVSIPNEGKMSIAVDFGQGTLSPVI